ncbi:hypothetical protein [Plastoroseomonas hellenica]|uniref:hypothetical protein n=1 Tax=Plastoroseomonas hellenica TaxID=2687306 RepID=UPI001BA847E0|nr:hypothetical protein [Plastoroseomonas hellenica]MBR0646637.1 hypothetical protein [Plastoroseomonas hellenica]
MRLNSIPLAALLLLPGVAAAQPAPAPGRYQAVPGNPTVLIDTATGQSWVLVQTPGPPVQWAPLRFWTPGNVLAPLPPAPGAVGNRPSGGGN